LRQSIVEHSEEVSNGEISDGKQKAGNKTFSMHDSIFINTPIHQMSQLIHSRVSFSF
jgi:hypothetical protein